MRVRITESEAYRLRSLGYRYVASLNATYYGYRYYTLREIPRGPLTLTKQPPKSSREAIGEGGINWEVTITPAQITKMRREHRL